MATGRDTPELWALQGHPVAQRAAGQSGRAPCAHTGSPLVPVPAAVGDACAVAKEHV